LAIWQGRIAIMGFDRGNLRYMLIAALLQLTSELSICSFLGRPWPRDGPLVQFLQSEPLPAHQICLKLLRFRPSIVRARHR